MGKDASDIRREIDETRTRLGETVDALAQKAEVPSGLLDRASEKLETVRGTVGGVVGSVKDRIPDPSEIAGAARRGYGIVAENPLGLALGALAVGFLAGLVVPVSDYERRTVGPIRDDLVGRAQLVGADAVEHGRAVLQETAQATLATAQRSFQTHGHQALSEGLGERGLAGTVIEHGRAILNETARTAAETARQAATEHGRQVVNEATGQSSHGQAPA